MRARNVWVDNVKLFACILVALGHFFQSMTKAEILPNCDFLSWFNQTIYYFHVPLFFVCSGYLYQRFSKVDSIKSWGTNILKKLIALLIPYAVFSTATWVMKTVFSGSVNSEMDTGILTTLFVTPVAPYWYLYALFFIFLITPTFSNKKMMGVCLGIALVFKILSILKLDTDIFLVSTVLSNEIWFMFGMCFGILDFDNIISKKKSLHLSLRGIVLFLALSILAYKFNLGNIFDFLLGALAVISIVILFGFVFKSNKQKKLLGFMSKYTMHIFLMHTIFAAAFRTVLIKVGITNAPVHIIVGILASFAVPILVGLVMEKLKWPEIFIYPAKFIKVKEKSSN